MEPLLPIAITLGDPGGVGPELIVRVWSDEALRTTRPLVVAGEPEVLREATRRFAPGIGIREVPQDELRAGLASFRRDEIPCVRTSDISMSLWRPAQVNEATGEISRAAVEQATRWALDGLVAGVVTLPISKFAWHQAGLSVPGHTEYLAELCGVHESAMMLYLPPGGGRRAGGLGVVHATLHMSVAEALARLDMERIVTAGDQLFRKMEEFRRHYGAEGPPRIGLCALNPHAGEEGLFGDEESRIIAPAVQTLRAHGHDADGPWPADTLLSRAARGAYDGVVAMYHDQGHIAIKLIAMFEAVNITLGLPIVRTSVAHGTAVDIAWQGIARTGGLVAAIQACEVLCRARTP